VQRLDKRLAALVPRMRRSAAGLPPEIPMKRFQSFAEGLDHPEGLAFDADGMLWAGGELGQIYRMDARGRVKEIARLGGVCNFKRAALIHVNRKGRVLDCIERVGNRKLITPNFSVFDSEGNLYFTDSGEWDRGNGCVYRLRANGRAEFFAGPFAFANGMSLSADEKTLYVVQTQRDNVMRIPILADGRAGKSQVYASGLESIPDGAALDVDGNLYVTTYATHCVYRIAPDGRVSLFAKDPSAAMLAAPTNAAFGGSNFDEMYFANLNRWHICRVKLGVRGQLLANLR
jgi:gluconolactonase